MRAEGREPTRSATEALISRLTKLKSELELAGALSFGSFCFLAEQTAWAAIQTARALLFDARSDHLPRSDNDLFAAWVKHEWIGLSESRRLKQFCELRNLSAQEPTLLDESGIRESAREGLPYLADFLETAIAVVSRLNPR